MCEFDTVTHAFRFEDLPYYDFNDPGHDDFTPLLVAIANAEGVVCGMGSPLDCIRLESISKLEVGTNMTWYDTTRVILPLGGTFVGWVGGCQSDSGLSLIHI